MKNLPPPNFNILGKNRNSRRPALLGAIGLLVILSLLVFACRKDFRKTNNISNPEYTEINVVPEDIAKLVAEGFNPKKIFFCT